MAQLEGFPHTPSDLQYTHHIGNYSWRKELQSSCSPRTQLYTDALDNPIWLKSRSVPLPQ